MDSSEQSIPNFTTTALLISKDCARPMDTKNGGRSSHCGSAEEGLTIEVVIAVFFSPQNVQFTRNCCQICNRTGHTALDYYHRMDYSFHGRKPAAQLAPMAASLHPVVE